MPLAVVAGALANKPHKGGEAWVRLSYVLGLRRLGWAVHFVEQIDAHACGEEALAYADAVAAAFGLSASSSLLGSDGTILRGPCREELLAVLETADLLLNVSGNLRDGALLSRCSRKAYVDLDPGYTQSWHAGGLVPELALHDCHFTVGARVGEASFPVAGAGIDWRPTRPPVVLDEWPVAPGGDPERFTSVASWRGFGPLEHAGRTYTQKAHQFRKFFELPRRTPGRFEVALEIDPAEAPDLARLDANGWHRVDPREAAGSPAAFRSYIQGSGAEFSVAQGVYVETRSGWFSDRTTRYLASGKPALVQETGLSASIETGAGLLTFETLGEAVAGAAAILSDHAGHSAAARRLAEEYFDSDRVLTLLLEDALA